MGARNSSKTRVVPIFDALFLSDATGATWLGARGADELALPAPLALLEYLVRHVTIQQVAASGDSGLVLAKRQALANRDRGAIEAALSQLREGRRGRKWFVLEGPSRPDATLEMPTAVVVVEGKRTERGCTSTTKWMSHRSQLVRHMDAAMESFPGKRILGLLLVEGGDPDDSVPSAHWCRECEAQCSEAMLAASLPHRTPEQRAQLAQGLLGVATWQAVCSRNRISWPLSNETAEQSFAADGS